MLGRKKSEAQNRKRKKEAEIAFKKLSVLLAAFLKKAKKEVEAADSDSIYFIAFTIITKKCNHLIIITKIYKRKQYVLT